MIYEKVKFTGSKPINEIDPNYTHLLKHRIFAGYVFKGIIPCEYNDGILKSVYFLYEDKDEDHPARRVLEVQTKNVELAQKKNGKTILTGYEEIINAYTAPGREYVGCIPRAYGLDGRIVSVTLLFLGYASWKKIPTSFWCWDF